ncbi:MAG: MBL fold metallo-hydrolase [Flavobacteriales bacterium]|nr:MBL fold metallo-hydrolase [Flavobacteriales bacterium]
MHVLASMLWNLFYWLTHTITLCVLTFLTFDNRASESTSWGSTPPVIHVLGTVQDGGSPHIGCDRICCRNLFLRPATDRQVVSLGLIDADNGKSFLFEATPDLPAQWHHLQKLSGGKMKWPDGIFLTHAHMGHYSGLMHLGREALGSQEVPVYAMPRMMQFLQENGPWSQLVELKNITLMPLEDEQKVQASDALGIIPIEVPHRDEFSETVGYRIVGPNRSVLFIPDINKWDQWDRLLEDELREVDRAYLDATFYDVDEVGYRDMAEIPHPFMIETMDLLQELPQKERSKVHFIHMNHTNPCLDETSAAYREVRERGFNIARLGDSFSL